MDGKGKFTFNDGNICGSLVVTEEGLYNIRKKELNHEKIYVNEDKLLNVTVPAI